MNLPGTKLLISLGLRSHSGRRLKALIPSIPTRSANSICHSIHSSPSEWLQRLSSCQTFDSVWHVSPFPHPLPSNVHGMRRSCDAGHSRKCLGSEQRSGPSVAFSCVNSRFAWLYSFKVFSMSLRSPMAIGCRFCTQQ